MTFDITPTNLRRAFDTGLDADTLLERQTAVSERGTELPQPLAYTVKDVARTHGRGPLGLPHPPWSPTPWPGPCPPANHNPSGNHGSVALCRRRKGSVAGPRNIPGQG
nr:helicase-associated domain-containing protein [Actinacidiphila oryziradicis]